MNSKLENNAIRPMKAELPLRILTVGDGDFSLSLALARAYGRQIDLSASTLEPSRDELLLAYPNAEVDELVNHGIPTLYGVDATQLHVNFCSTEPKWDIVLFHHPHLGLSLLNEQHEERHAHRHHVLLSHYLYSASMMLCPEPSDRHCGQHDKSRSLNEKDDSNEINTQRRHAVTGLVHVCLCGTQADTWRLFDAAKRQGLKLVRSLPTSLPFHHIWHCDQSEQDHDEDQTREILTGVDHTLARSEIWQVHPAEPGFAAPRRYRNGKLGSRHFLGKYGYRHRRTEGEQYQGKTTDMNVSGSMHYVFSRAEGTDWKKEKSGEMSGSTSSEASSQHLVTSKYVCLICDCQFESQETLDLHLLSPAKPEKVIAKSANAVANTQHASTSLDSDGKKNSRASDNPHVDDKKHRERVECKQNPPSQSTPVECAESYSEKRKALDRQCEKGDNGVTTFTVSSDHQGRRLRWYLRQCIHSLTKRTADSCIQAGRVVVNCSPAFDSSRILSTGDVIEVSSNHNQDVQEPSKDNKLIEASSSSPGAGTIHIVQRIPSHSIIVAWKPAGVRTKGMFLGKDMDDVGSRDTIEGFVSKLEGTTHSSLSRLDTSCPGLCALTSESIGCRGPEARLQLNAERSQMVVHVVTALVHGMVPDSWCSPPYFAAKVPVQRQWKKKRKRERPRQQAPVDQDSSQSSMIMAMTDKDIDEDRKNEAAEDMELQCSERIKASASASGDGALELSTVTIRGSYASANSISAYLRQLGYPVVGDRYCRREYLSLKRSIRNRIKDKLCLGCYQIVLSLPQTVQQKGGEEPLETTMRDNGMIVSVDVPEKLSALYWQAHVEQSP